MITFEAKHAVQNINWTTMKLTVSSIQNLIAVISRRNQWKIPMKRVSFDQ